MFFFLNSIKLLIVRFIALSNKLRYIWKKEKEHRKITIAPAANYSNWFLILEFVISMRPLIDRCVDFVRLFNELNQILEHHFDGRANKDVIIYAQHENMNVIFLWFISHSTWNSRMSGARATMMEKKHLIPSFRALQMRLTYLVRMEWKSALKLEYFSCSSLFKQIKS